MTDKFKAILNVVGLVVIGAIYLVLMFTAMSVNWLAYLIIGLIGLAVIAFYLITDIKKAVEAFKK